MTADERAQFDRDGFLVIPSVLLSESEIEVGRERDPRYERASSPAGTGWRPALCTSSPR